MARIGAFTVTKDGCAGTIQTLTINTKARTVANDQKTNESAPDFRVYGGKGELGAAWKATSISVKNRASTSAYFSTTRTSWSQFGRCCSNRMARPISCGSGERCGR